MARSEAPSDPRPYVRVSTDLPMNPKLGEIDDPAAGWAYVVALCYCANSLTDGHFPVGPVLRMANVDMAIAMALAEQGLWHLTGHDCDRCEQPRDKYAVVHDFLQHQRSADEVRDLTSKRREAGRKGAKSRWAKPDPRPGMANAMASAMPNAMASDVANAWQSDGKTMAEERRGEEKREEPPSGVGAASDAPVPRKRATRLPDDFAVTDDMKTWHREKCPHVDGPRETEKFRNYWTAKSGKDATKHDWTATWRNWMLRAADDLNGRRSPAATGANRHVDSMPREQRRARNPFANAVRSSQTGATA